MAWKYCPNCEANSIRDTNGICVICKQNFSEEIEASVASTPLNHQREEQDMAKKKAASRKSKVQPKRKAKRLAKSVAPVKEQTGKPKQMRRTPSSVACELLLGKKQTDQEIADILIDEFGALGYKTSRGYVANIRCSINEGYYKGPVAASGVVLPLPRVTKDEIGKITLVPSMRSKAGK